MRHPRGNIGNCHTDEDGGTTQIACTYDHMGRRATKKVTTGGSVTLHPRYLYRGCLQVACCDLTRGGYPCLWLPLGPQYNLMPRDSLTPWEGEHGKGPALAG